MAEAAAKRISALRFYQGRRSRHGRAAGEGHVRRVRASWNLAHIADLTTQSTAQADAPECRERANSQGVYDEAMGSAHALKPA